MLQPPVPLDIPRVPYSSTRIVLTLAPQQRAQRTATGTELISVSPAASSNRNHATGGGCCFLATPASITERSTALSSALSCAATLAFCSRPACDVKSGAAKVILRRMHMRQAGDRARYGPRYGPRHGPTHTLRGPGVRQTLARRSPSSAHAACVASVNATSSSILSMTVS